ncbi:MAG TPA: hypothetical protein DF984_08990 [Anaerolineaceae bacterium]|nr:hypothetical protein [Anaerolineaceae bacterium]
MPHLDGQFEGKSLTPQKIQGAFPDIILSLGGGTLVCEDREGGVTQPERGVKEDEEGGGSYGFGPFRHWIIV